MSRLTESIERALSARAGLYLAVLGDEEAGLVLSGMVASEELRQAALDIARALAGPVALVGDITVTDTATDEIADVPASARSERGIARLERAPRGVAVEPGDFSIQHLVGSADEASGPSGALRATKLARATTCSFRPWTKVQTAPSATSRFATPYSVSSAKTQLLRHSPSMSA